MRFLRSLLTIALAVLGVHAIERAAASERLQLTTFRCDVTPPKGQPLAGGDPLQTVEQPLLAKGIVLEADGRRYVICAVDWCVVCNDSYRKLRAKIAEAAGVPTARVAVQTVHQHTAPAIDIDPNHASTDNKDENESPRFDPAVFDSLVDRIAAAVKQSRDRFEPFDHVGAGRAKVKRVASARRIKNAKGELCTRWSYCENLALRNLPEGKIDPFLKTVTFARGEKPLVRLHYYATHPQTIYRDGRAGSDIPGIAREKLEQKEDAFQIYFTGCAGDVTVGKYNDRTEENRAELAERLLAGMEAAAENTEYAPVGEVRWRTYSFSPIWKNNDERTGTNRRHPPIELTSLQLGHIHVLHLPGEPMLCFQLHAQQLKAGSFVAVAGYGDDGTGYICPESAFSEGGYEPSASELAPQSEAVLKRAIAALLGID